MQIIILILKPKIMKKLLQLFSLLIAMNGFSQAIVLLDEDFDGNSLPNGWTSIISYGNHDWSFGSATMPGNSTYNVTNFPNNAAIFDDDAAGSTDSHNASQLLSPEFSVAEYPLSAIKLRYQYAINNKGANGDNTYHASLKVRIEDNAGHGYNFIASHIYTTNPIYHWVDIRHFLNNHPEFDKAHLRIRWHFDDHGTSPSWGWGVGLDDIALMVMPENDTCSDAQPISLASSSLVSNEGASDSGIPIPSCGQVDPGDIWFKCTVPASGSIIFETTQDSSSPLIDTVMNVYSGSCSNLQEIACNDDAGGGTLFSLIELDNQTPGSTLYIRVFTYQNDPYGTFYFWAYEGTSNIGISNIPGLKIYPNPADNVLHLKSEQAIEKIEIFNLLGQKVLMNKPRTSQPKLNISNLSSGSYIIKIKTESQQEDTYHFVKK